MNTASNGEGAPLLNELTAEEFARGMNFLMAIKAGADLAQANTAEEALIALHQQNPTAAQQHYSDKQRSGIN